MASTSVKMDGKGRLVVPKDVREALGAQEGDVFYFEYDAAEGTLVYAAVQNPLLQRLHEGRAEYAAGLTKSLDDVAAEFDITIDRDAATGRD